MIKKRIREGFDKLVRENAKSETLWYYLHVNGVVIKVKRDSFYTEIPMDKVSLSGKTAFVETSEIIKAGYEAVESLV